MMKTMHSNGPRFTLNPRFSFFSLIHHIVDEIFIVTYRQQNERLWIWKVTKS